MEEKYIIAVASVVPILIIGALILCWWISLKRRLKSEDDSEPVIEGYPNELLQPYTSNRPQHGSESRKSMIPSVPSVSSSLRQNSMSSLSQPRYSFSSRPSITSREQDVVELEKSEEFDEYRRISELSEGRRHSVQARATSRVRFLPQHASLQEQYSHEEF